MSKEKSKLYILAIAIPAVLSAILFVPSAYCRIVAACVLTVAAVLVLLLIKKKGIPSLNYRQVTGLLAVIAVLYLVIIYVVGIWVGFHLNRISPTLKNILKFTLPSVIIIISTELLRARLVAQAGKAPLILSYITCVLVDLLLADGLSQMGNLFKFVDIVGLTLFPAITANLLYNYLSKRYGALPNIVYRLIMTLAVALIPIAPSIPDALNSFVLMLLPLAILVFIDILYEKHKRKATVKGRKWANVGFGVSVVAMAMLVMLVSGQFRYTLLVIATPSMTGSINKGDAVIYEKYDGDVIEEGDVIVFTKDGSSLIVHRVVDIQKIDGNVYYTTKGDANTSSDSGFVVTENIRGIVKCKVSHVGHPSLWLRDLFSK